MIKEKFICDVCGKEKEDDSYVRVEKRSVHDGIGLKLNPCPVFDICLSCLKEVNILQKLIINN